MATTLDGLAGTELEKHLAALTAKLDSEYPTSDNVHQVIDEERQRFADARIHSFLPILIERSARSRLRTG
jgi:hypothetical protein